MAKQKRTPVIYGSYRFIDKDPIMDCLRTARQDSGLSVSETAVQSNVSATTIANWEQGKTRKPQFATAAAVATVYGKKGVLFNKGKPRLI